ncbi:hypothetical protein BD410DRAFT_789710 [Rickenella mellea]|uniref:E3 ubiquitin-protein ligase PEP5 n=1 Tax=Rickenella mellea TaxID=50990 RepID=A0A4Y7Q373_9AGAM|nr:hypothetical protein BD410DRAFT_789710 [Rickenella mellea]
MTALVPGSAVAPAWRQFPFFEVAPVKDIHDLASPPEVFKNTPEISAVSPSSVGVLLADIYGTIHVLSKDFESVHSWVAHVSGRVTHMVDRDGILVTVGEEESTPQPLLKIWDLRKLNKTSTPKLLRSIKLQHGNRPHPVSTVALSSSLSHLAIGLADGTVLLFRHIDQSIFSGSTSLTALPKPRIIHESPTEPITGLGFREPTEESQHLFLFIVTINRVLCYQASGRGSGGTPVVVDEVGAGLGCAVMDWRQRNIIVARDEAIYMCSTDGRGPSVAYEGHKSSVHTHLNYLIIVSPPFFPSASAASATVRNFVARTPVPSGTDVSKVTVFDLENKFIAYSGTFTEGVRAVVSEWGQIFILANDGKLSRLEEKPTPIKLEMLYQKPLFKLALDIAKTQGLEASSVADIHRRYGDHLYSQADYDGAMQQFIKTIGYLQPSYVIRKFLDAQRIHNLVTYLQELHSLGLANSDHTTLLLNTYTKLKDVSRLDSFIRTESRRPTDSTDKSKLPFDLDTAIRVCRQAGYFEHASYLAKKYDRHEDYLRIQVEDAGNYADALAYLRQLDPEATESSLARYGRVMLANLPDETTQLLIDICTGSNPITINPEALPAPQTKSSNTPSYLSYLALNRGSTSEPPVPPTPSTITAKPPDSPSPGPKRMSVAESPSNETPVATTPAPTIKPRVEKRPSPRLYFANFVDNMEKFVVFLEAVALRRWGQTVEDIAPGAAVAAPAAEPLADEEADKRDQVAVWITLLELYLTLHDKDGQDVFHAKALRLLKSEDIPYDSTHALILCSTRNFTPGLVLLWEKLGMYEEVLRFWMDKHNTSHDPSASAQVIHYLNIYGPAHPHLYVLVVRFLTSSPELLSRHAEELGHILEFIDSEKIIPPLGVIQVLSRNGVASVGLVKQWLMARIKESQDGIQTDRQLINSYREETKAKLQLVEELSDPEHPRVFHVTKCSACNVQLDLPSVHFMCNHSYHQRCLAYNETECPTCAQSHGLIREIRSNNERLAGNHELFLSEVKENGFSAVAGAFSRGMMGMTLLKGDDGVMQ